MIISVKKSPNTLSKQKPLTLNGQTLQQVNTYKYLGVLISSDLKWSPHIAHVSLKARRILGALYHGCYSCHLNLSTAILLYKSMVRPHLEYSCHIWSPHTTRDIQALESVQNFALRVITKHWTHSYEELLSLTTLPTLEKGLYLRLQFYTRLSKFCFFLMVLLLSEARHATIVVPLILFLLNNHLPEPTDYSYLLLLTLFLLYT